MASSSGKWHRADLWVPEGMALTDALKVPYSLVICARENWPLVRANVLFHQPHNAIRIVVPGQPLYGTQILDWVFSRYHSQPIDQRTQRWVDQVVRCRVVPWKG